MILEGHQCYWFLFLLFVIKDHRQLNHKHLYIGYHTRPPASPCNICGWLHSLSDMVEMAIPHHSLLKILFLFNLVIVYRLFVKKPFPKIIHVANSLWETSDLSSATATYIL